MSKYIDSLKVLKTVNIKDTTQSNDSTSGALVVAGGMGISKNLNIGENISFQGRMNGKVVSTAGNYSLGDDYILNVTATAIITLPDVSAYEGVTYVIQKQAVVTVTVNASGADNISIGGSDVTSVVLDTSSDERLHIVSDGTKWQVMESASSGVPDAPTSPVATLGVESASVAFTAPTDTGGSPVLLYNVVSSPDGITGSGLVSPIVVTGLTGDTAYTFTVTAVNRSGAGSASVASNSVTPTAGAGGGGGTPIGGAGNTGTRWVGISDDVGSSLPYGIYFSRYQDGSCWSNYKSPIALDDPIVKTYGIAYNGSKWIISADDPLESTPPALHTLYESTNGEDWTKLSFTGEYGKLAYSQELNQWLLFGSQLYYSNDDGLNWTNAAAGTITAAAHNGESGGNSRWVGFYSTTNSVPMYSSDGINWTSASPIPITFTAKDIAYGNGVWVMVGDGNFTNTIYTSSDGITWTGKGAIVNVPTSVAYYNNKWVIVAQSSNIIQTSVDGITWSQYDGPVTTSLNGYRALAHNGLDHWIMYADTTDLGSSGVYTSTDGTTWTLQEDLGIASGTQYLSHIASTRVLPHAAVVPSSPANDFFGGNITISGQLSGSKGYELKPPVYLTNDQNFSWYARYNSIDGDYIVISNGDYKSDNSSDVYVYKHILDEWVYQQTITLPFNNIVLLKINGDTIIMSDGTDLHIYNRSGEVWSEQQIITPPANIAFPSIDILGDTIIIPGANISYFGIWTRSGGVWTEEQDLGLQTGSNLPAASLGVDVLVLTSSNDYILRVYRRSLGVWTEEFTFNNFSTSNYYFDKVEMDKSGTNRFVANLYKFAPSPVTRDVYIFEYSGSEWNATLIKNSIEEFHQFYLNGNILAISSTNDQYQTTIDVYTGTNTDTWLKQYSLYVNGNIPKISISNNIISYGNTVYGTIDENALITQTTNISLNVSGFNYDKKVIDGDYLVVFVNDTNIPKRKLYVYHKFGVMWNLEYIIEDPDYPSSTNFGTNFSISGNTIAVISNRGSGNNDCYIYVRSGSTWDLEIAHPGVSITGGSTSFGSNGIKLIDDRLVISDTEYSSYTGAIYIYTRSGTVWSQEGDVLQEQDYTPATGRVYGKNMGFNGDYIVTYAQTTPFSIEIFVRDGTSWSFHQSFPYNDGRTFNTSHLYLDENHLVITYNDASKDIYKLINGIWYKIGYMNAITNSLQYSFYGNSIIGIHPTTNTWEIFYLSEYGHYTYNNNARIQWNIPSTNYGNKMVSYDNNTILIDSNDFIYSYNVEDEDNSLYLNMNTNMLQTIAKYGKTNDLYGSSVSIYGDYKVIGAPGYNSSSGLAYVYVRSTNWLEQQLLTPSDGSIGDNFGVSVAIYDDTIVVGSNLKNSNTGAAYVFVRNSSGTAWSQQAILVPTAPAVPASGDYFGTGVAIYGDTIVVGAYGVSSGAGASYVFTRSGTVWTQEDILVASDTASGDWFGDSVAIYVDSVIIGARQDDSNTGAAYVFTRSGITWSEEEKLTASDASTGDEFGGSVDIGLDLAIVGARLNTSAYIFRRSGITWSQEQILVASDPSSNEYGVGVAIYGELAIVGAKLDNSPVTNAGSVYLYTYNGLSWDEQSKIIPSLMNGNDNFGSSVSINKDNNNIDVIVGAPGYNSNKGSVYIVGSVITKAQFMGYTTTASFDGKEITFGSNSGGQFSIGFHNNHGRWMVCSNTTDDIKYSDTPTDTSNWTTVSMTGSGSYAYNILFVNNTWFVNNGYFNYLNMSHDNGDTWSPTSATLAVNTGAKIATDGKSRIISGGSTSLRYSDNWGDTSTLINFGSLIGVERIAYGGGVWVICGNSSYDNTIAYSLDGGTNWIGAGNIIFTAGNCTSIAYNGYNKWFMSWQGDSAHNMATSDDGINWTGLGKLFNDTIYKITYHSALNRWVVTDSSSGYFSDDNGNTWNQGTDGRELSSSYSLPLLTPPPMPTPEPQGLVESNFLVAAGVGTNTLAHSSDNGATWTPLGTSIFDSEGHKLTYNGTDLWVATGSGSTNTLAKSTDGIAWTGLGKTIFTTQGYDVAYNGYDLWVAVGEGTNTIAYSSNGTDWTGLGTNVFTTKGLGVAYNGYDKWVAVGEGGNTIAYSYDGITWVGISNSVFSTRGNSIAHNGTGTWVAVGQGANSIAYSNDGSTWTGDGTSTFSTQGYDVAYNGKYGVDYLWVAVGEGTNSIAYSSDAITWTPTTNVFSVKGLGISYNGVEWVAVGDDSGTNTTSHSVDAITWSSVTGTFTSGINVASKHLLPYRPPRTLMLSGGGGVSGTVNDNVNNAIAYSYNGVDWHGLGVIDIFDNSCRSIAYGNGKWVAVGKGTTYNIAISDNGISWTGVDLLFGSNGANGVAYGESRWIAVGHSTGGGSQKMAYSDDDGATWTYFGGTTPFNNEVYSISHNGIDRWVARGDTGQIANSTDNGVSWAVPTTFNSAEGRVAYANGTWVATGGYSSNFRLAYSTDGSSWTGVPNSTTIFTNRCVDVVHNGLPNGSGGLWVAVGFGTNAYGYSSDGITWTAGGNLVGGDSGPDITSIGFNTGTKQWIIGRGSRTYNRMFYHSYDGINWVRHYPGSPLQTNCLCFSRQY